MVEGPATFEIDPSADIRDLVEGRTALVSIDADFFVDSDEGRLAVELGAWLAGKVAAGVRVTCRDDHVDLVDVISAPIDIVLNFDYHMDLSLGFLFGDEPRDPPEDATVFETILASNLAQRYVWAHPVRRRRDAATVYSAAVIAARQPILRRIHCMDGAEAMPLLARVTLDSVFVCRSPGYATAATDRVFRRLVSIAQGRPPSRHDA